MSFDRAQGAYDAAEPPEDPYQEQFEDWCDDNDRDPADPAAREDFEIHLEGEWEAYMERRDDERREGDLNRWRR